MQTANFNNQKGTFATLHGKTGNKAMTQARVQCHGMLSITPISWICAYLIAKQRPAWQLLCGALKPLSLLVCQVSRLQCDMTRVPYGQQSKWNKTTDNKMIFNKKKDEPSMLIYLGVMCLLPFFSSWTENWRLSFSINKKGEIGIYLQNQARCKGYCKARPQLNSRAIL